VVRLKDLRAEVAEQRLMLGDLPQHLLQACRT
jgi:hypothetical protein